MKNSVSKLETFGCPTRAGASLPPRPERFLSLTVSFLVDGLSIWEQSLNTKSARGQEGRLAPAAVSRKLFARLSLGLVILLSRILSFAQETSASTSSSPPTQTLNVPAVAPEYRAQQT